MLTLLVAAAALPAASPAQTPWGTKEHRDKMTDAITLVAETATKDGAIFVGCDAPAKYSVRVRLITTSFLGEGGREIMFRLDDQKAVSMPARYSDNMVYTFSTDQLTDWVKAMRTASIMRIRLFDFRGDAIDLEYSMDGAAAAIDRAVAICNDKRFASH